MKQMRYGALAAAALLAAAVVTAAITTQHIATDAELVAMLSDTMFVCEGRIGDRGGMATFELNVGPDTGDPASTANYDWHNGVPEPFTIAYDNVTSEVSFSLGGVTLYYTTPYFDFDQVFIRTRAVETGSWVLVDDLVIDGEAVDDASYAVGNGLDILWIRGTSLNYGFVLSGTATLAWTGTAPTQSRLAFQVKVGKLGVVSSEESSWGRIKLIGG